MTVFIRVVILKLGEIDTVKECFSADAFIQAKWRERAFDYNKELVISQSPLIVNRTCIVVYVDCVSLLV